MIERAGHPLLLVVAIAIPILVSLVLPHNDLSPASPFPLVLLVLVGALVGWVAPSIRAWAATAGWVVLSVVLVLVSWTDMVLDVTPTLMPAATWREAVFVATVVSVALVTTGFVAGALLRGRRWSGSSGRGALATVVVAIAIGLVGSALTAYAFSGTGIVLQDDVPRVTVVVTDAGVEVSPTVLDGTEYRLVYESRASTPRLVASVAPLGASGGRARALTEGEIATWLAGAWDTLGPEFATAVQWVSIAPGDQQYSGPFRIAPSPDFTGGAFWYQTELDDVREWPQGSYDGEGPEPAPFPVQHYVVVPVEGG